MSAQNFASYEPAVTALRALPDGAAALILGPADSGKTTFVLHAGRLLSAEIGRIAIVDADLAAGEIAWPGVVGLAPATAEMQRLADLRARGRRFVGAFTPHKVLPEWLAATANLVQQARTGGARRILVDTPGLGQGMAATRARLLLITTLTPDLVLAPVVSEQDDFLSRNTAATGVPVLALSVLESAGRKSAMLRATRQRTRLASALENAREISLPLRDLLVTGAASLGTGTALAPHLILWVGKALRLPVVWAEQGEDGVLSVFANADVLRSGWEIGSGPVADQLKARAIRAVALGTLKDALLGLHDHAGRLIAPGRFLGLDTERGELSVCAPPPASDERVKLVCWGRVRVREDCAVRGDLRG